MKLVIDIETDRLVNPTKIWVVVCKDIDTGEYHVFRNLTDDAKAKEDFLLLLAKADTVIGHFILSFDCPVLSLLLEASFAHVKTIDTLVVSKLADYSRVGGHSIEQYGLEFGLEKIDFKDFSFYSKEMEEYCARDVDIAELVYDKYRSFISSCWDAVDLEQRFQSVVNQLTINGFAFNKKKAEKLLEKVKEELHALDIEIEAAFPPRLSLVREVHPKLTQYGTLHKGDFRWVKGGDLSEFNGGPFSRCVWKPFNASSHKQIIDTLHAAGWTPTVRTKTHADTERSLSRLKYSRDKEKGLDLTSLHARLEILKKYGWAVNEANLSTLPPSAPKPARTLAKRILLESRRRTLVEWLGLCTGPDGHERIHGSFYGIGAWTHRMAHQRPNTANIPNATKEDGSIKLLGKELRSLWMAPKNRLLVGVDAEGIQLRVFAHIINDKTLIERIVNGRKEDKTDPHNYNKSLLGSVCKSRQAAKRFLYALFLGAGIGKLAAVLDTSKEEAEQALNNLLKGYPGFDYCRREIIPSDAKRGYFIGLDGRRVPIPGDTVGERKHLCMSGYLQNGEVVIMKRATLKWHDLLKEKNAILVNFVHDEWQTECPNNLQVAQDIAQIQSDSLRLVGEELKLNCPLAGSFSNDHGSTIGVNWYVTH